MSDRPRQPSDGRSGRDPTGGQTPYGQAPYGQTPYSQNPSDRTPQGRVPGGMPDRRSAAPVQRRRMPASRPQAAAGAMPGQTGAPRASAEKLRRIERRKARTRAVWLSAFVLLIMFLTVVMIITIMQRTRPKPRFQFIQSGEITHTVQSVGLILRDEDVFNAATAGTLKPLATEGSRAAKGQKVALVIPANRESDLRQLQKTEKDIVDLQNQLMDSGKGAGARAIFDESRNQLSTLVNLVRSDASRGDLSSLNTYKTSMDVVLDQRSTRLLTVDFKDVRLEQLRATRANLEKQLGLAAGTIICQKPGIISFRLDGLEAKLNTSQALTLSFGDFRSYRDGSAKRLTTPASVQPGKPVLRITSSLGQVLAFEVEGLSAERFQVGKSYDVSVPKDGIRIDNCVVLRSEQQDRNTFLVLRTDRKVESLSDRRVFDAVLAYSRSTGMKVPISAIQDLNESASTGQITLVAGGYTRRTSVKILDKDRDYAIIEAIDGQAYKPEISSVLVLNPSAIEEGEFIGS